MMHKTRAQQRVDHIESLERPLTDEESDELRRSLHAVYCHSRKAKMLGLHRKEELALLKRLRREAEMPSDLS